MDGARHLATDDPVVAGRDGALGRGTRRAVGRGMGIDPIYPRGRSPWPWNAGDPRLVAGVPGGGCSGRNGRCADPLSHGRQTAADVPRTLAPRVFVFLVPSHLDRLQD